MRVLADTNILARIAQSAHKQHAAATTAVERILARDDDPCIVPQIIYEFWVVATRPASKNGLALTVAQVQAELVETRRVFTILRDERAIFQRWERLVVKHDVKGKTAHDARIVAAMHRHGLTHILTFNATDFARFPGIVVVTPETLGV